MKLIKSTLDDSIYRISDELYERILTDCTTQVLKCTVRVYILSANGKTVGEGTDTLYVRVVTDRDYASMVTCLQYRLRDFTYFRTKDGVTRKVSGLKDSYYVKTTDDGFDLIFTLEDGSDTKFEPLNHDEFLIMGV